MEQYNLTKKTMHLECYNYDGTIERFDIKPGAHQYLYITKYYKIITS